MARKLRYEIRIYKLSESNTLGIPIERTTRRLKVPPHKDATTYGKPVKIRRQKGWSVIELDSGEVIIYRKFGAGKYPNLFERFWKPKDSEDE